MSELHPHGALPSMTERAESLAAQLEIGDYAPGGHFTAEVADFLREIGQGISDGSTWIVVSELMPEPNEYVLAYVTNSHGKGRRIRARWVPKLTVESSGEQDEFAEYDEKRDTYYTPEGWYECNEYEETNWKVDDPVTHWMPLPEGPK